MYDSASRTLDFNTLRAALEQCNVDLTLSCYADDAELRIVDCAHQPSTPQVLHGKQEIGEFYKDICSRNMTHHLEKEVMGDDRLALVEACQYPTGQRVIASSFCDIRDGKITSQLCVQAWDA